MWEAMGKTGKVKTRKEHKCEFCGDSIPKGNSAYFVSGIYDGEFINYYWCLRCKDFIDTHDECFNSIQENGFEYGEYYDWLHFYRLDSGEND